MKDFSNTRRRAVINGLTIQLFRISGNKRSSWVSIWPEISGANYRTLKRWADKWLDSGVPPKKAMH